MSDPIEHFRLAIATAGLEAPDNINADGAIHRFSTNGRRGDDSGWYSLHTDGIPAGAFGCWREGLQSTWCAKTDNAMTDAERGAHRQRIKAMQAQREAETLSARSAKSVIPTAAPFELGLSGEGTDIRDLMDLTPEDVAESQRAARHDLDATNKASAILRKGGDRAYDKAQRALLPDSREWWQTYVEEEEYSADADGLAIFIREHLEPLCYLTQEKILIQPEFKREAGA